MNNIKEEIGSRIRQSRTKLGLTVKQLSEKTVGLKPARISNWEQGLRIPGPLETSQLAKALEVSPSWLLGFTELENETQAKVIPVIPLEQLKNKTQLKTLMMCDTETTLVTTYMPKEEEKTADYFGITLSDRSMTPDFVPGDTLIFLKDNKPKPGNIVLAYDSNEKQFFIRKYAERSSSTKSKNFSLIASNQDWPSIESKDYKGLSLIGCAIELRKSLR